LHRRRCKLAGRVECSRSIRWPRALSERAKVALGSASLGRTSVAFSRCEPAAGMTSSSGTRADREHHHHPPSIPTATVPICRWSPAIWLPELQSAVTAITNFFKSGHLRPSLSLVSTHLRSPCSPLPILHLIRAPSFPEPRRFDAPGTHSCAQETLSVPELEVEEDVAVLLFSPYGIL
jgi:hypothetical protein